MPDPAGRSLGREPSPQQITPAGPTIATRSACLDRGRRPAAKPVLLTLFLVAAGFAPAGLAAAQTVGAPAKHNNNTYGSPLDTLKSSRLWTDTPEPKDFVRDSRPPAGSLDYTPLTGVEPERTRPRDAANVAALQAELERAGDRKGGKARRMRGRAGSAAAE